MNALQGIRVKICGITRLADAEELDALGVDYLGFNFFPGSKRFIEPAAAAKIIARLKKAEPVGVFVDASPAQISAISSATGIRRIQLHGREGWDIVQVLALPVIKAIPHSRLGDYGGLKAEWDARAKPQPEHFLVDTQAGSDFGGTGQSFDWSLLKAHPLPRPVFLAGGIGPDNVAEAAKAVLPFAVDLNSKVETSPGIKSTALVGRCLGLLRG